MIKIQKLEKQHAIFVGVGLVAFAILAIALVILSVNRGNDYSDKITGYESGNTEGKMSQNLIMENYYQLTQTYGYDGAATIRKLLQSIILSEDEMAAAPTTVNDDKEYFPATLIESSFERYDTNPDLYMFTLETSDERIYQVYVHPCFDDTVSRCYAIVAIRDDVVNFASAAESEDAVAAMEAWKNEF